jgi:NAD(P)-dependent dehydrogenase (short-subunit alcohol dehydrogenase family)
VTQGQPVRLENAAAGCLEARANARAHDRDATAELGLRHERGSWNGWWGEEPPRSMRRPSAPMATVREVFETNTFEVMAMRQAVLPQLRTRRSGVAVDVISSATLAPMPLVAVYTASKTAIEGFTASLAHELEAGADAVRLANSQ